MYILHILILCMKKAFQAIQEPENKHILIGIIEISVFDYF